MIQKNKIRKITVSRKNIIVFCTVILTAAAAIVVAGVESSSLPSIEEKSVLLEQADSGVVIGDSNEAAETEGFFSDQSAQSMNFRKDMPIRDALRFLGAKYQKNIIPSANINGKINITSLYNVSFEQALNAILGPDYHYEIDGSFIRVYTTEEYAKYSEDSTRLTSRVYTLYYTNATDVQTLITPLLSTVGKIAAVGSDSSSSGGSLSSGSSSSSSSGSSSSGSSGGGNTVAMRDTVVVYDFPDRLDKIGKIIKEVDVRPQQIMIEVTILTATLKETTNFGINWEKVAGLTNSSFNFTADLSNTAATAFTADIGNDKLTAAITAQEDIVDTTVLANPKIMALNKQSGYINIGKETGYTKSTTQNDTGTTADVEMLPSGTILRFRPFICDNGYVRMEINPEESTASTTTVGSTVIPSKTITTLQTNIMVKDGKTIIIGGLFKEDLTDTDKQVPIVGDMPIIGGLFKSTSDVSTRTELVVLITPHIIDTPDDFITESNEKEDDVDRLVSGSRKRTGWGARERLYEDGYAKAIDFYADKEYNKALTELDWIIAYRPNALEAVKLREKILAETNPTKLENSERVLRDKMDTKLDKKWKRR
jgi:type II secretory pathway component GspD/PulD (secretin)